jgi:hypothetical protein
LCAIWAWEIWLHFRNLMDFLGGVRNNLSAVLWVIKQYTLLQFAVLLLDSYYSYVLYQHMYVFTFTVCSDWVGSSFCSLCSTFFSGHG